MFELEEILQRFVPRRGHRPLPVKLPPAAHLFRFDWMKAQEFDAPSQVNIGFAPKKGNLVPYGNATRSRNASAVTEARFHRRGERVQEALARFWYSRLH